MTQAALQNVWIKRDKTFIFLVPPEKYARQSSLAHGLAPAVKVFDWRAEFLEVVAPEQKYLGLTVQDEQVVYATSAYCTEIRFCASSTPSIGSCALTAMSDKRFGAGYGRIFLMARA